MSVLKSMRPPVDIGPCQVRGHPELAVTGRTRVMWEDGVLYVARNPANVVSVRCPEMPLEPVRVGQNWIAQTSVGTITFKRRGCSCSYRIGNVAFGALAVVARPVEGVESTSTPSEAAHQPLEEADTP